MISASPAITRSASPESTDGSCRVGQVLYGCNMLEFAELFTRLGGRDSRLVLMASGFLAGAMSGDVYQAGGWKLFVGGSGDAVRDDWPTGWVGGGLEETCH